MAASVNVIKYTLLHQYEHVTGICTFFCFSSDINLQMSTERIATKILPTDENLITKKDHMNPDTDVT